MTTHVSSTALEQTPHETLRHRAQAVITDTSIDSRWRTIIRYALEINDLWLPDLVRRAEAGEPIIDSPDFSLAPEEI